MSAIPAKPLHFYIVATGGVNLVVSPKTGLIAAGLKNGTSNESHESVWGDLWPRPIPVNTHRPKVIGKIPSAEAYQRKSAQSVDAHGSGVGTASATVKVGEPPEHIPRDRMKRLLRYLDQNKGFFLNLCIAIYNLLHWLKLLATTRHHEINTTK